MFYSVKRGDSPASIARRHGVSVGALLGANPHKPTTAVGLSGGGAVMTWTSLADGERLNIPSSTGVGGVGLGIAPAPLAAPHKTVSITNPGPHVADADVALLQTIVGVTPDGLFGPNTQAAVKRFQSAHGLAADGIAGPKTWAVAVATATPTAAAASLPAAAQQILSTVLQTPTPAATPAPVPVVTPVAVPAAAQALASIDPCYSDNVAMVCAAQAALGVTVDGKYGNDTATALRRFVPGAPPGCSPRPSWWTPTGKSNCTSGAALPPSLPSIPSIPTPSVAPAIVSPGLPSIPSVVPAPSIPAVVPAPVIPSVVPTSPAATAPAATQPGPIQPAVTAPSKQVSTAAVVAGGVGVVALVAVAAMAISGKKGGGGHHAPASRRSGGHRAARKHASRKRR